MKLEEALAELRKEENKRKFDQSVDLIINLKGIDPRKDSVTVIVNIPHKIKDKRVCGFLSGESPLVKSITPPEFTKYKEKNALKKLVKDFDFFIAIPKLMPSVATTFGKILGPAGKMPSPQLGMIPQENEEEIKKVLDKIAKSAKIRIKEASVKISLGKESMKDEEVGDNVKAVYSAVLNSLPAKKDNIKSVMIKLTMSKPLKVEM
jgi:large subunit ribosomal protein L1